VIQADITSVTIAGTPVAYSTKYLAAYAYLEIETGAYTSVVDNDLVITLNNAYDIQVSSWTCPCTLGMKPCVSVDVC
jgi:hypothetical protein